MKHALAFTAVALTATVTLTVAACGGDADSTSAGSAASSTAPTSVTGAPAAGGHNQADVTFVQAMIPHHAQAVEMSNLVLGDNAVDPAVQELARDIKAAQSPEIEKMTGWLVGWDEEVPAATGMGAMEGMDHGSTGMPGMMSEEEMTSLQDASGEEASRLFLEQMVEHHRGAIAMAEMELESGRNDDAKALARQIIDSQQLEITTMTELLAG